MKAAFFEIDWDDANDFTGNWEPAGGTQWFDKVDQSVTVDYAAVELQGPDPGRLGRAMGQSCRLAGATRRQRVAHGVEQRRRALR